MNFKKNEENKIEIEDIPIIEWDYTVYEYDDLIGDINESGWIRKSSIYSITNFDKDIVKINNAKLKSRDIFMEITCPKANLITIAGLNQCDIDEDFIESPNLYEIPHFFTLRCKDDDDFDIRSTTIINISKVNSEGETERLYQEFYGDLSPVTAGRLKAKQERYYFLETIILQKNEKLIFQALNPDRDIAKVDLFMMCDFFIRGIKQKETEE